MKKLSIITALLFVPTAFAQFSQVSQQQNPQSAKLATLSGKVQRTANSADMEHELILGKHQTFFYPDSIRHIEKNTHHVAVEYRANDKPILRQLWQIDCDKNNKNHFAQEIALVNFASNLLSDTPSLAGFSSFRQKTGEDLAMDLDYSTAQVQANRPVIAAACQYIHQHK